MPQDRLKSVVYGSFVTCDDPKGVIGCKTFRNSKSASGKMENKTKSQKTQKKSDRNSSDSAEKRDILYEGIKEEFHYPSSFQLQEVSRGAQELNRAIDSWLKGVGRNNHSKDIAKDLLRGAVDLQESLLMLGKLQEASDCMAKLKNKQKEMSSCVRIGENKRTNSSRFRERNYVIELQNPHFPADGSSKNCTAELKKAIRESLAKHNLLPNTDSEEETFFSGTYLDSPSDIPSTSSSQSSTAHGCYFSSSNSSIPMAAPKITPKSPNLIAKLMGLEDMPSKPLRNTLQKQFEMENSLNPQMPLFDIDMPQFRKPQFVVQKREREPRKLEEILESMHFNGLLKSNSMKEVKSRSRYSNDSFHKRGLIQDAPPIVIMKPLHNPCWKTQQSFGLGSEEEVALETEIIPRKLKAKGELYFKTSDYKEELLNSSRLRKKMEAKESPAKRHMRKEKAKDGKEREVKAEVKEAVSEKKLPAKMKTSGTTTWKPQKKNETGMKTEKMPKVTITTRKPTEKVISKVRSISSSQDGKVPPTESIKLEKGSNISKMQTTQHQRTKSSSISTSETPSMVHPNCDCERSSRKKGKAVSKHKEPMVKMENLRRKGTDQWTEHPSRNESAPTKDCTAIARQLPNIEGKESFDTQIEEQGSISNVTKLTAEDPTDIKVIEEAKDHNIHPQTDSKSLKNGAYMKALLLSNQEFLSLAEELFNLDMNVPKVSQTVGILNLADPSMRLSLDCANELLERRSSLDSQMFRSVSLVSIPDIRSQISLDRLLEEVCNGVETLRSHGDVNTENHTDSLSSMLERDIKRKEISSSIWDLGWRNVFSVDDAMHVVNEMECLLLCGLFEEIFA